jgi:integrase
VSFLCELPSRLFFPFLRVDNKKTECLTGAQIKNLLAALDADYDQIQADVMRLALYTGMRKTALLNLQWDDLDFKRGFILLRGEHAKNKRSAKIPMSTVVRRILEFIPRADSPYLSL